METLTKLIQNMEAIGGMSLHPRLFPGKLPTRVHVSYQARDGRIFDYVGKGVPQLFGLLDRMWLRPHGLHGLSLREYDRNGLLFKYAQQTIIFSNIGHLVFPLPPYVRTSPSAFMRYRLFRDRALVNIKGRPIYISTWLDQSPLQATYRRYVQDCANGVMESRFMRNEGRAGDPLNTWLEQQINPLYAAWLTRPRLDHPAPRRPQAPEPDLLTGEPPTQEPPRHHNAGIVNQLQQLAALQQQARDALQQAQPAQPPTTPGQRITFTTNTLGAEPPWLTPMWTVTR